MDYEFMRSNPFASLSDESLRRAFRKHTIRGLIASLMLLVLFVLFYIFPVIHEPEVARIVMLFIAVVSVAFAVWYHLGRRRYYKEFRRRNMQIRG